MARLHPAACAEWDRKVRIETNRFHGRDRWVPVDTCGAWPVNVYWYPEKNGTGPYLRFRDPMYSDYMLDLKHGTTLLMARNKAGIAYVGEISSPLTGMDYSEDYDTGEITGTVDEHPMYKLEHRVASSPGLYLGRIEYPFNRFVSKKEAPEQAIPQH